MAKRTGVFVLGLALVAATSTAEIVEEERFDLPPHSELTASDGPDGYLSFFEPGWVVVYAYENPPLVASSFEASVDDIQPSALPREAMVDDTLSFLPLPDEDRRLGMEQHQHQAP